MAFKFRCLNRYKVAGAEVIDGINGIAFVFGMVPVAVCIALLLAVRNSVVERIGSRLAEAWTDVFRSFPLPNNISFTG